MVRVSEAEVTTLRRKFERIKRVAREHVAKATRWEVHNELLPKIDAARFQRTGLEQAPTRMVRVRREGSRPSGSVLQASVSVLRNNLPALAAGEPRVLLQLHAEIERVTLERMIERLRAMLQQELPEARWQRFFEDNIFILSLLFSRPVRLLHSQFHAQGSGLSGAGAQVGDFLLGEAGQALAIVEIKKPGTPVTASTAYRNTEVYGPHKEIAGAVTQVLVQQNALRVHWHRHRSDNAALAPSQSDVIRCVVVAGMTPTHPQHRRSFDIFRNACKDVEVITFDELLGKLELLREHLEPPTPTASNEIPF